MYQFHLISMTHTNVFLSSLRFALELLAAQEHLKNLLPKAGNLLRKVLLVRIDDWLLPHQVGLNRIDELGFSEKLPSEEQYWRCEHHEIKCEESVDRPASWQEYGVPVAGDHASQEDQRDPCAPRLEAGKVWHCAAVETLSLAGAVEEEVGDADDD